MTLGDIPIIAETSHLQWGTKWHVRRALAWVNPADLAGVDFLQIESKLPQADTTSPEWHKSATEADWSVNGVYFHSEGGSPAYIKLFIRDLYRGIPKIFWLTPVITLVVAQTLAHEVGHHLIAERGYVFTRGERITPSEYEEEMAHRYAQFVIGKMKRRWYYRLAVRFTKHLAVWHSGQAYVDWKMGNYERAAESWYRSFHLDPDRVEEVHWYKCAREAAQTNRSKQDDKFTG